MFTAPERDMWFRAAGHFEFLGVRTEYVLVAVRRTSATLGIDEPTPTGVHQVLIWPTFSEDPDG